MVISCVNLSGLLWTRFIVQALLSRRFLGEVGWGAFDGTPLWSLRMVGVDNKS